MALYVKWLFLWLQGCARLSANKSCVGVCVWHSLFQADMDKAEERARDCAVSYADVNLAQWIVSVFYANETETIANSGSNLSGYCASTHHA